MSPEFWSARLTKNGHTGWSDPFIYAFDQLERLGFIEASLSVAFTQTERALDFGCGTGDFSRMLVSKGFCVCGFDPFVNPNITHELFNYAKRYEDIPWEEKSVDLGLTVTVLDHVMDEAELGVVLKLINKYLRTGATLQMLEYALDDESDRQRLGLVNGYQCFRTIKDWERLLGGASFEIVKISPSPHPIHCPSQAYLRYRGNWMVRLINRIQAHIDLGTLLGPLLRLQASSCLARSNGETLTRCSPLKLITACAR